MNDHEQTVNKKDQMAALSLNGGSDLPERLWAYEDFTAVEDRPADSAVGLVSLGFIRAAIRRSAWFWCTMTVVGLLAGFGLYAKAPPAYQASTSLILTDLLPGSSPGSAILDDQAVAQSRTVAGLAVRKLGLRQSVSSFLAAYTVTVISPRVLLITVNAPSSTDAVSRANALATEYLRFRAYQLVTEQQLILKSLDQHITQAKQHISSISNQMSQLSAQSASSSQQARLSRLRTQRSQATVALNVLVQNTNNSQAGTQTEIVSEVKDSRVLDPAAPILHSRLKHLLIYIATGMILGLALGLGIVVVRALVSDRLFRRDDVTRALGAPVKLSVGKVRLTRWLPGRRGLAAARGADVNRIVTHLGRAVPPSSRGSAALAVVPVDDPQVAALCLVSLAVSCAQEGDQVVVADLCSGAPAARLLGAKDTGVRAVSVNGAHLVIVVPPRDDVVPVGPLPRTSRQTQPAPAGELVAACSSADLLLTLATLDPSLGGEHLPTWATDAVVVVTAGRSSWTKINAVGEMIRLAGTRLVSAVLLGADKTDESLGVIHTPGADHDAAVVEAGLHSEAEGFFVTVDGGPAEGSSDDR